MGEPRSDLVASVELALSTSARREVVDEHGYLHAIAHSASKATVPGYVCTCGAWRPIAEFDDHLEELGATTVPPALPLIDAEMRARATAAGRIAAGVHNTASEDEHGFVVCNCRMPFPAWDDWGDHYAQAVLTAALNEISNR